MRLILRTLALSTVLLAAALPTAKAAGPGPLGTCRTLCYGETPPPASYTRLATAADCCSGSGNACPPGTTVVRPVSWNGSRC